MVLFGLMLVNFLPFKIFPKIYPPISEATQIDIINNILFIVKLFS